MSEKVRMEYTDYMADVFNVLAARGLLLAAWKEPDRHEANAMMIGWGMIGWIWKRPVWQVVVRPSRYTHELIEREGMFSVNVMPLELESASEICGRASGRSRDKLKEAGFSTISGEALGVPVIAESIIHYECRVVQKNDFVPDVMAPEIQQRWYPGGDYHRIYFGEIMDARVTPAALGKLFKG